MNREVCFANQCLNYKNLNTMKSLFDDNEEISKMIIYVSRRIKENKILVNESKVFSKFSDLIEYLDSNGINIVDLFELEINYKKNKNRARLVYEDACWKLSYCEQDTNIDSLIYNFRLIFKNSIVKIYRKHRDFIALSLAVTYMFSCSNDRYTNVAAFCFCLFLFIVIDSFFVKNVAYKNKKFWIENKSNIILSVIFMVLGYVFNEIIDWIIIILFKM